MTAIEELVKGQKGLGEANPPSHLIEHYLLKVPNENKL